MRRLIVGMLGASAGAVAAAAAPQDCPTAQSAATGFVVERGEKSKTEVFHVGNTDIRTVLRFDGTTLLETTQFQGMFDLERIDRGRRTVFRPTTDLSNVYPPKVGQTYTAGFEATESERRSQLVVALTVRKMDNLDIPLSISSVSDRPEHHSRQQCAPIHRDGLLFARLEADTRERIQGNRRANELQQVRQNLRAQALSP